MAALARLCRTTFMEFLIDHLETPIGIMRIVCDDLGQLRATDWDDHEDRLLRLLKNHYGEAAERAQEVKNPHGLSKKLKRYFEGDIGVLDSLPTATNGTEFQRDVWSALRRIPGGTTISYGQLAERIGRPKAVRAVGTGQRLEPDWNCCPVPSRHRFQWQAHRLWWRAASQGMAAAA